MDTIGTTLNKQTISTISRQLRTHKLTSQLITETCLEQISLKDKTLNAFITVFADEALQQACEADRELKAGLDRGPLHGIPLSLKDLIDVRGTPTTAASRVREDHVATADANIVTRLRKAGTVLIGKCNLHEFALGTTNEDSAYGPAKNPFDLSRSPGGSSGGSAVSVAAGMSLGSIGTDTGGSIRIPSAACGLVGLKPAYQEISMDGIVPLSHTLDHAGPLCHSVEDASIIYRFLCGMPETSLDAKPVHGLRLGVPRTYFLSLLDTQVAASFEATCDRLAQAGVILQDVNVPHANDIVGIYTNIILSEAATHHAQELKTRASDYTTPVRVRLELGNDILEKDYVKALHGQKTLRQEVDAALNNCNGLLLPTVAVPATVLGANTVQIGSSEESIRKITLRLTQLFNLTGHPALTMPCGQTIEGLPIGAQLVGPAGRTGELLQLARNLEGYISRSNA